MKSVLKNSRAVIVGLFLVVLGYRCGGWTGLISGMLLAQFAGAKAYIQATRRLGLGDISAAVAAGLTTTVVGSLAFLIFHVHEWVGSDPGASPGYAVFLGLCAGICQGVLFKGGPLARPAPEEHAPRMFPVWTCSNCGQVSGEGTDTCSGCGHQRSAMAKQLHEGVSPQQVAELCARLERDLRASGRTAYLRFVEEEAKHSLEYVDDPEWFAAKVPDDVQQRFHDEQIDNVWPACPLHHHHPLWLHNGMWVCEKDGVTIAALGALPTRSGGPSA